MSVMLMEICFHELYESVSCEKRNVCHDLKFVKLSRLLLLLQVYSPHRLKFLAVMEVSYAWYIIHINPTYHIYEHKICGAKNEVVTGG